MKNTWVVIMAGGKGERFWPKSTDSMPKHLISLFTKETMLQQTIKRSLHSVPKEKILVVTNKSQQAEVKRKVKNINSKNIIAEPFGRNTAAAIGLAAVWIKKYHHDAVMAVLPSDHIIEQKEKFAKILSGASDIARKTGALITLGIKPKFAFTGYGYIKVGKRLSMPLKSAQVHKLDRFVEKPDKKTALAYLKSGKYLWNSGIFIWKAKAILDEIKKYMPELYTALVRIEKTLGSKNYEAVLRREYSKLKSISIDYGIMEKTKNALVLSADVDWNDIGSWTAIVSYGKKDKMGNVVVGDHEGFDTRNCTVVGSDDHLIATIGVNDLIIVSSKNATLICRKDKTQEVKELVHKLKADKRFAKYTK